jgi:hypothetical protein
MKYLSLFCALLGVTSGFGQALPASPPRDEIIKVEYHCAGESAATCRLGVTKDEFGALVRAIDPNMSPVDRQILAAEYSRLLIMASHARAHGVDQSPEFQTLLQFSTLQLLSSQLVRQTTGSAVPVAPEAEEAYYRGHLRDYQEVALNRVFVPAQANHGGEGARKTSARAEAVRSRAVSGEDFAGLQREMGGDLSDAPAVPVLCLSLPEALRQVCDLRPGEISPALPDGSGYSIYRLESKRLHAFSEVRQDIHTTLARLLLQTELEKIRTPIALDLDESYFGKLPGRDVADKHGMHFPATNAGHGNH